jgi:hypothetical protein
MIIDIWFLISDGTTVSSKGFNQKSTINSRKSTIPDQQSQINNERSSPQF